MPAFADTNVVVAFSKDDAKIAVAEDILEKQPTISGRVIPEDLQHGRTFDGQLTVVNPFVAA